MESPALPPYLNFLGRTLISSPKCCRPACGTILMQFHNVIMEWCWASSVDLYHSVSLPNLKPLNNPFQHLCFSNPINLWMSLLESFEAMDFCFNNTQTLCYSYQSSSSLSRELSSFPVWGSVEPKSVCFVITSHLRGRYPTGSYSRVFTSRELLLSNCNSSSFSSCPTLWCVLLESLFVPLVSFNFCPSDLIHTL